MTIKVALIGAGAVGWTRKLLRDMLVVPELQDTVFAFTDIDAEGLDKVARLCRRDIEHNHLPAKIIATTNRRKAIEGADYVFNVTRIGGHEGFHTDVAIPLKYGVDQCVGDTLCVGGIMYGQRNIPCILDFCKDIREVAKPGALLFNYANPNAMNTWAANQYGGVKTVGLCHGVIAGHKYQIADVIRFLVNGKKKPGSPGYRDVSQADIDIICAGINHQTWYIKVLYDGKDWTGRLLEGFEKHPIHRNTEKVRIDILRNFGYFTTESNGHVSEYLAWYRKRPAEISQWTHPAFWNSGETAGYLRLCIENRRKYRADFQNMIKGEPRVFIPEERSIEHGSYIIEALQTGRVYRGHFNVINNGCIANLPDDACVEVPGYVDRNGINIPLVGPLPLGCAAVCNASISVQRLAVEAAIHGDVALLKQAALMDPLTGAVCNPQEISQMIDEMLVAQAKWLPQYKKEIPKARKRLASEKPLDTHVIENALWLKPTRRGKERI